MRHYQFKPLVDFIKAKGIDITQRAVLIYPLGEGEKERLIFISYNSDTKSIERGLISDRCYRIIKGENINKRTINSIPDMDGVFFARRGHQDISNGYVGYIIFPITAIKSINRYITNKTYALNVGWDRNLKYVNLNIDGYTEIANSLRVGSILICEITYMISTWKSLSDEHRSFFQLVNMESYNKMNSLVLKTNKEINTRSLDKLDEFMALSPSERSKAIVELRKKYVDMQRNMKGFK